MRPHLQVRHPDELRADTRSDRFADAVAGAFGSMWMFWLLVGWQLLWMAAATLDVGPFGLDRYPFAFLLFLSNLVQLWALPVLGTATNRADAKRAAKADADHAALSHIAERVDALHAAVADRGTL